MNMNEMLIQLFLIILYPIIIIGMIITRYKMNNEII